MWSAVTSTILLTVSEPHDIVRSSVARIKDSFWFYFSELVEFVLSVFLYLFVLLCVCSVVQAAFMRITLMMMMISAV